MPRLTRLFIKAAFAYLVAALIAGVALAARPYVALPAAISALGPVYFHLLMVGWVTQMILGVAYWMFPVHTKDQPHGHEGIWWATFWMLNAGLLLRVVMEPLHSTGTREGTGWILITSALLQTAAGLAFVANTWRRVKER